MRRERMASASLMSAKGPICTRNSLSVAEFAPTSAGYCFFFSASTRASASSCLLTAATCTKYELAGRVVEGSGALEAELGVVDELAADALAPELAWAPELAGLLESPGTAAFPSDVPATDVT